MKYYIRISEFKTGLEIEFNDFEWLIIKKQKPFHSYRMIKNYSEYQRKIFMKIGLLIYCIDEI